MGKYEYEKWIKRERRLRLKILQSSPIIREESAYRICQECGEACLCHEENCPNCNSSNIQMCQLNETIGNDLGSKRIRCKYRFGHLPISSKEV